MVRESWRALSHPVSAELLWQREAEAAEGCGTVGKSRFNSSFVRDLQQAQGLFLGLCVPQGSLCSVKVGHRMAARHGHNRQLTKVSGQTGSVLLLGLAPAPSSFQGHENNLIWF